MTEAPPSARDWVGDAAFPWPAVASLEPGAALTACYAVVNVQALRTRQDKPFLKLQLIDLHGPLEARVWDDAERIGAWIRVGAYVGVTGRVEIFNNERQLKVERLEPVRVPLEDLRLFLPRSSRPVEAMEAELGALLDSIADPPLRALLELLIGAGTETGRAFRLAPAAKQHHHAYLGGLWEHTLSMTRVCDLLARHYGAALDRDLLLTAALLHDIGKIREIGAQAGFPYTDEGKLLGHILIGLQIVRDAARQVPELATDRLLLLEHLIASHQGRYEWQSPREPRILEGIVLHYADDLDAKVTQVSALLEAGETGWTAYDRAFQRDFLRHRQVPEADPEAAEPPMDRPAVSKETRPVDPREPERPRAEAAADSLDLFED